MYSTFKQRFDNLEKQYIDDKQLIKNEIYDYITANPNDIEFMVLVYYEDMLSTIELQQLNVYDLIRQTPVNVSQSCFSCGCEFKMPVTSKTNFKEITKGKHRGMCSICNEKSNEKSKEHWKRIEEEDNKEKLLKEKMIQELKAMPYKDYLNTEYWKKLRIYALKEANFSCKLCKKKGELHVHHSSYAHRGEGRHELKDLICLCSDCHSKFHDKEKPA